MRRNSNTNLNIPLNTFQTTGLFSIPPLKTSFQHVFRGYRKIPVVWNGLSALQIIGYSFSSFTNSLWKWGGKGTTSNSQGNIFKCCSFLFATFDHGKSKKHFLKNSFYRITIYDGNYHHWKWICHENISFQTEVLFLFLCLSDIFFHYFTIIVIQFFIQMMNLQNPYIYFMWLTDFWPVLHLYRNQVVGFY